ncbi:VTC domain-containing protein [Bacillus sp. FSL K6-3431]|uniref:VTC domain-containing protein n=1 Tax=Bacillus sp. FSL K6-3431 TaxID=2921500 RepID=UPI0030FBC41F
MAIEIFIRREQKYLITRYQYEQILEQISSYMRPVKYGRDGRNTVTSQYFDNQDHQIYYETKNKLKFEQKL